MASQADIEAALRLLSSAGYQLPREGDDRSLKSIFDERNFRMCDRFDGTLAKWDEWKFNLLMAFSVAPDLAVAMRDTVMKAGLTNDLNAIRVDQEAMDKYSQPLFRTLCLLTTGEANVVVRSANDRGAGFCGFAALCLLSQRFNPKTPGRVLQYLTTVLSPAPVKDVRLLQRAVEDWEAKRGRLKAEFDEEFSDNVCIAILTSMLPRDLQDLVFQQGQVGEALKYQSIRDKVMSIASHRSQMATPAPMDIGYLGEPHDHQEEHWACEEWQEVDAVTKGNCHACGGWGHFARECPTQAAKGKGKPKGEVAKGWGKAGGKNAGKGPFPTDGKGVPPGKGWTPKGGGKGHGYQGTCYRCGVVGHKAAECSWRPQVSEVAVGGGVHGMPAGVPPLPATVEPAGVSSVGGVWAISAVSKEDENDTSDGQSDLTTDWQVVRGRWKKTGAKQMPKAVKGVAGGIEVTSGQFGSLMLCPVEEEGEATEKEGEVCGVTTEITVDSAAEESVCPLRWAEQFGLDPVEKGREMKLVNASGGRINHWGCRKVVVHPAEGGRPLEMGFQVTDVKKPLLAVSRLCERGNLVQFGPEPHQNFVMNVATGERLTMLRRGNSWVLPGEFAEAGRF